MTPFGFHVWLDEEKASPLVQVFVCSGPWRASSVAGQRALEAMKCDVSWFQRLALSRGCNLWCRYAESGQIAIKNPKAPEEESKKFTFDKVFDWNCTQREVGLAHVESS